MSKKDIHCKLTVSKAAPEVFEKICRIHHWWTVDVQGEAGLRNGRFTARFGENHVTMEVMEWAPSSRMVWLVRSCYWSFLDDRTAWVGSMLAWEIAPRGDLTQVSMTHSGLPYGTKGYAICSEGWGLYVGNSLRGYINRGAGTPFKPGDHCLHS
jgi:hypothetical protein